MPLDFSTCLKFYKRKDIQEAIIEHAARKEIGVRYNEAFGKRPDILMYPKEIMEFALRNVTSFHASEELWDNPLDLNSNLTKKEMDELRVGWDLVLDIDCKFIDYSKICADLIIKFLKYCGVRDISCKFSVTGDTHLLIKIDDTTKLIPIKEVVELIKKNKKGSVLSLDQQHKVCFSTITGYLEHQEKIYEVYHENSTLPIKVTGYHSVFVWDKGTIIQKKVSELSENDYLISFRNANQIERKVGFFEWEYEYLYKKVERKIEITKKLMLLLGYYLAEGHITKTIHQIGFSFNTNEKEYINECIELLKEITQRQISIRNPNPNTTQILIHSKEWYAFFEKICGKGARNKHVPEFSWSLPKDYFEKLLLGYLRGDGYKVGEYSITAKSVSYNLIRELVWLSLFNNISCSLNQENSVGHYMPQGTFFKGSSVYSINIPKSELTNFEFFRERNKYSPYPKNKTFPIDGLKKVYYQIKPKLFNHHRVEQVTLNKKSANLNRIKKVLNWFEGCRSVDYNEESKEIINNYSKIYSNDLMILKVQQIILKNKEESVYDISVENTENFFGGNYPILLHNSGNKGFHIGVPFEAFPVQVGSVLTKTLFPEAAKKIAFYIKENIKEELGRRILEFEKNDFSLVKEKVGLPQEEITRYIMNEEGDKIAKLEVEKFLEIDTILISPRHLYRMPYSLHEKSGLVSLPIDPDKVMEFERSMAEPEKILSPMFKFLEREVQGESARRLLMSALDFEIKAQEELKEKKERKESQQKSEFEEMKIECPITEEFFPPCVKLILKGVEDGKKRGVFCLSNFLGKIGWGRKEIEEYLLKWNTEKNKITLRDNYVISQLRYFKPGEKLPPNCDNEAYYLSLGVCQKDSLCLKIKNPVNYTLLRWKSHLQDKMEEEEKGKRGRKKKEVKVKEGKEGDKKEIGEKAVERKEEKKIE